VGRLQIVGTFGLDAGANMYLRHIHIAVLTLAVLEKSWQRALIFALQLEESVPKGHIFYLRTLTYTTELLSIKAARERQYEVSCSNARVEKVS
jgi:hypothetical protein